MLISIYGTDINGDIFIGAEFAKYNKRVIMIIPINFCSADINSDIFICAKLREIKYNYVATFSPKPTIVATKVSL